MYFVVTGADRIGNLSVRRERYVEYILSLHRIFSYKVPVIGVLSELDETLSDTPPFDAFPFKILNKLHCGALDGYNKSEREFMSIKSLLPRMEELGISDNEFIIKSSGRYMLVNDSFFNKVKASQYDDSISSVIKLCDLDKNQQFTFLYAIRYKYFKEFYSSDISILRHKNVEQATIDFLKAKGLYDKTLFVNSLGILSNINNEGAFTIY
jgi:hypothetical protein